MRNGNAQPAGVKNWKTGESEPVCLWLLDHAGDTTQECFGMEELSTCTHLPHLPLIYEKQTRYWIWNEAIAQLWEITTCILLLYLV